MNVELESHPFLESRSFEELLAEIRTDKARFELAEMAEGEKFPGHFVITKAIEAYKKMPLPNDRPELDRQDQLQFELSRKMELDLTEIKERLEQEYSVCRTDKEKQDFVVKNTAGMNRIIAMLAGRLHPKNPEE